ncbi:centrosome and spindle pole associated protein 1-like isoform X5 [Symsagittifera roscoffensis]|uniref:centrosome and spindle pole associated protein 1-like isoform X5 n=1 Tax=Symsagittifera roscoffensis TaxID=84072 RepID=UPI00307B8645
MADDLEEFIQAQKAKLAQARRSHGIKQPQQVQFHQSENAGLREIAVPGTSQNTVQPISSVKDYTESGVNFGDYENKKRLYQEERKAETRSFLAKDRQRKPVDRSNIAPEAGLHIRDTQSDKKQKEIERNREYNQFLAANPKNNPKSRKPEETGPGNQNSYFPDPDRNHENKLRNERNREYNEYLRQRDEQERLKKNQQQQGSQPQQRYQPAPVAAPVPPVAMPIPVAYPGAGGAAYAYYGPPVAAAAAVPDYNELLRQKMELEQKYRQSNGLPTSPSAAYYNQQKSPQTGGDGGGYQPRSQGAPRRTLPPVDDLEARMQTYDFELGKRKQILKDDSSNSHQYAQSRAVINDPSNMMDPGRYMGGDTFLDDRLMSQFGRRGDDPSLRLDNLPTSSAPQMQQPAPNRFVGGQGGFSGGGMGGPLTAPGGPPDPNMEKRRKQQEYKQQLEAQMSASAMAKRIEKEKNLQINLTGEKNPSKFPSEFMRNVGVARDPQVNMARHAQSMPPPASHGPLLDKPLDMWATGVSGGMGGLGPTAYDPNYQYYATADPLDPMMVPNSLGGMDMSNMHQQVSSGGNNYQADLLNQMREKQDRQYRNKMEQERWERKKDAEEQYFPFGKGGGGAPLKDADGKIIADLRELHHIAETSKQPNVNHNYHGQLTEVTSSRPNDFGGGVSARDPTAPQHARGRVFNDAPVSKQQFSQQEQYKLDLKRQIEERNRVKEEERKRQADEDAREEQKIKAQMAQIQAEYDKEQEKIRKKAEEQQKKNDELRVAAEEKRLAVDRARKEEEEKQADERRREMERELEERRRQQQQHDKPKSPPVPAQQQQQQNTAPPPSNRAPPPTVQPKPAPPTEPVSPDMPPSHPVRLTKNKTNPERDASRAEVNRQLSAMRKQLLSEQRRIEMQIDNKNVRERPSKPQGEMILTEPAKVRRPAQAESWKPIFKDEPNEAALDLFMHSKYDPLTRSRDNFRQEFPNAPQSSDMLEVQQRELIRQQERELLKLRQVNPEAGLGDIREDDLAFLIDHPDAKSMPLASDSAYIGMNGETLVPTPPLITKMERMRDRRKKEAEKPSTPPTNIANEPKLKDLLPSPPSSAGGLTNHHRNRSANTTNNTLLVSPDVDDVTLPFEPFQAEKSFSKDDYMNKQLPNPDSLSLGSNFSFDVDAVARKNKERLKKLDNSREDDDLSITDPDEVLRKFVDHDLNPKNIRPISRMTNDTEPDWLRPTN